MSQTHTHDARDRDCDTAGRPTPASGRRRTAPRTPARTALAAVALLATLALPRARAGDATSPDAAATSPDAAAAKAPAGAKASAETSAKPAAKAEAAASAKPAASGPGFNARGNFLVSDTLNNRVVEFDATGAVVWQFGTGPTDLSGASPIGPKDADRAGELTLVAATGIEPGASPACATGCKDNRVLLVDRKGKVVWQYGKFGVAGAGDDQLDTPVSARYLAGDRVLIADQGNHRVIEVDRKTKKILWQHGTTGKAGPGDLELDKPGMAEPLDDGSVLIADTGNNRAIEVGRDHSIRMRLSVKGSAKGLAGATRIAATGNFFVTDVPYNRIVELDPGDNLVWEGWTYMKPGSHPNAKAARVTVRRNGDLVIAEPANHRIEQLDVRLATIAEYGKLQTPGLGTVNVNDGLNSPYDAKVIGESTGLVTPGAKAK